jgi:hypothetical protein
MPGDDDKLVRLADVLAAIDDLCRGYTPAFREYAQRRITALPAANPRPMGEALIGWLPKATVDWLHEYDGPACAITTAIHRFPPPNGGAAVYLSPLPHPAAPEDKA